MLHLLDNLPVTLDPASLRAVFRCSALFRLRPQQLRLIIAAVAPEGQRCACAGRDLAAGLAQRCVTEDGDLANAHDDVPGFQPRVRCGCADFDVLDPCALRQPVVRLVDRQHIARGHAQFPVCVGALAPFKRHRQRVDEGFARADARLHKDHLIVVDIIGFAAAFVPADGQLRAREVNLVADLEMVRPDGLVEAVVRLKVGLGVAVGNGDGAFGAEIADGDFGSGEIYGTSFIIERLCCLVFAGG